MSVLLQEAKRLKEEGDVEQALAKYKRVLEQGGSHSPAEVAESLFNIGWIHENQGNYQQAIQMYQQCISIARNAGEADPLHPLQKFSAMSNLHIAFLLHLMERHRDASTFYGIHVGICETVLSELGKSKECKLSKEDEFFTEKDLVGKMAYALYNWGLAMRALAGCSKAERERIQFLDEAMRLLRRSLEYDTKHTGARFQLATLLMARGDWQSALEEWNIQTSLEPGEPLVHYNRALCLHRRAYALIEERKDALLGEEMLGEAVEAYRRAINFDPDFAMAYMNMGEAMRRMGEVHQSLEPYAKAVDIYEQSQSGDSLEALQGFDGRVPLRNPLRKAEAGLLYFNYGMVLKQIQSNQQALDQFRKAAKVAGAVNADVLCRVGEAMVSIVEHSIVVDSSAPSYVSPIPVIEEAIVHISSAISLDPNAVEYANALEKAEETRRMVGKCAR